MGTQYGLTNHTLSSLVNSPRSCHNQDLSGEVIIEKGNVIKVIESSMSKIESQMIRVKNARLKQANAPWNQKLLEMAIQQSYGANNGRTRTHQNNQSLRNSWGSAQISQNSMDKAHSPMQVIVSRKPNMNKQPYVNLTNSSTKQRLSNDSESSPKILPRAIGIQGSDITSKTKVTVQNQQKQSKINKHKVSRFVTESDLKQDSGKFHTIDTI